MCLLSPLALWEQQEQRSSGPPAPSPSWSFTTVWRSQRSLSLPLESFGGPGEEEQQLLMPSPDVGDLGLRKARGTFSHYSMSHVFFLQERFSSREGEDLSPTGGMCKKLVEHLYACSFYHKSSDSPARNDTCMWPLAKRWYKSASAEILGLKD